MTLYTITAMWDDVCDWCDEDVYKGEVVWYNPKTKKVYHQGVCQEKAEAR